MDKERNSNNSYVFGLDIGTRSVVGVVGYLEYGRFKIAAMAQQLCISIYIINNLWNKTSDIDGVC